MNQWLATWLVEHNVMWLLDTDVPWFIFTHYPEQNDAFSWLDGSLVIGYIVGTGLLALLAAGSRALGPWRSTRLHHLAQALIPLAGIGVFLGLSATTVSLLRAEHLPLGWVADVRLALLVFANTVSLYLGVRIIVKHARQVSGTLVKTVTGTIARGTGALVCFAAALAVVDSAWWLMFWAWQAT